MDELLVKYLADEATPPEQTMVEEWISFNPINRQYFLHFQLIWNESEKVAATATVDENKAWQRFQKKIKSADQAKRKNRIPGWWRMAASIMFIAGAAWLAASIINNQSVIPEIQRITSANEVIKDTLPDGSVATLNKHSVLSYPSAFKGKTRKVKLKGEAFFNVKADRDKPFIIDVNDLQVKVVGTSFNIRTDNGLTEVIVESGIVQVTKDNKTVELNAGERISLSADGEPLLKKEVSNDKLYNYYVSRTFVCDNTPLWKLVDKLNEAYNANIRIGKEQLRKLPLTVTFEDESLDVILNIIRQTLMIKIIRNEDEIILQ